MHICHCHQSVCHHHYQSLENNSRSTTEISSSSSSSFSSFIVTTFYTSLDIVLDCCSGKNSCTCCCCCGSTNNNNNYSFDCCCYDNTTNNNNNNFDLTYCCPEPPHHTDLFDLSNHNNNNNNMSSMSLPPGEQQQSGTTSSSINDNPTNIGIGIVHQRARATIGQWAGVANHAVQQLTVRKYTLPDKNVASQVLMYRQLLHTKCRPGLKLSRDYQGTPAQNAVLHMPWWCEGIIETNKMIISYDNLIQRLWIQGAIINAAVSTSSSSNSHDESNGNNIETLLNEKGMPPVPHEYWVSRLGFQQPDPVTDFRSGGVLSLAMMVWIVESCPTVFARYARVPIPGDASVLPFGITCINVTDMMSKFLMLAKSTDKMDALLSQKPFWKMFADPSALLACQELALDMLADVVQELYQVRKAESGTEEAKVTVFDFSHILSVTEKRVEYDLLGAGPTTVQELRQIHAKLKLKYRKQLDGKLQRVNNNKNITTNSDNTTKQQGELRVNTANANDYNNNNNDDDDETQQQHQSQSSSSVPGGGITPQKVKEEVFKQVTGFGAVASNLTGNVLSKIKSSTSSTTPNSNEQQQQRSINNIFSNPFVRHTQSKTSSGYGNVRRTELNDVNDDHHRNQPTNNAFMDPHDELQGGSGNYLVQDNNIFGMTKNTSSTSTSSSNDNNPYVTTAGADGDKYSLSYNNNISTTTTDTIMTNSNSIVDLLGDGGEWNTDIQNATAGVSNFSIVGDEDEEDLL